MKIRDGMTVLGFGLALALTVAACENERSRRLRPFDGGVDALAPDTIVDAPQRDAIDIDIDTPDAVVGFTTNFHVALAASAACAVFPDGRMKCWGNPFTGAPSPVGDGPGEMGANLPFVALDRKVRLVRGGDGPGFCAIFENGGLRCWAGGAPGQTFGYMNLLDLTSDIDLGSGRTAVDVAVGIGSTCAILDDGSVKCWGAQGSPELGQGDNMAYPTPPALPINLGTGRKAKALAAGYGFNCALVDNDRVKCWGRNGSSVNDGGLNGGALGIGNTNHMGDQPNEMGDNLLFAMLGTNPSTSQPWRVLKVVAANVHACALLENNRVKCWGRNDGDGFLGSENAISYGSAPSLVDDNMPFVNVGTDDTGAPWKVIDIDASNSATCVVLTNGGVRCWGRGDYGATGRGDNATVGEAVGDMGNQLLPVQLAPGAAAQSVIATAFAFCVTVGGTSLNCWGNNHSGALGQELPYAGTTSSIGDQMGEMGPNLVTTKLE